MHVRFSITLGSAIALMAGMPFAALHADVPASSPAEIQKARHHHYEELGEASKQIRDLSRSSNPDFAAIEKAAAHIVKATVNQDQWFPKGTGPEAGQTRALPEVWTRPADFVAAQKMFSDRAPALHAAAKAKDINAVRTSFRDVGASCKNCHDTFRSPED